MALSREEERDEAREKNQRKKDGHERLDEKEEKRRGGGSSCVYARARAVKGSLILPVLLYVSLYSSRTRSRALKNNL